MAHRGLRYTLAGLNLFLAANAIFGAIWVVPGLPREWLAGTPFPDYVVPALALGVVIGLGAVVCAVLVIARPVLGSVASIALGAGMMLFEIVETTVIGWDYWLHTLGFGVITKGLPGVDASGIPAPLGVPLPLWQQLIYFLMGALIATLGIRLWRARKSWSPTSSRDRAYTPARSGTAPYLLRGGRS